MSRGADTIRRIRILSAAYVAALLALVVAIAIADSRVVSGIALAGIIIVLLYARHTLRCPMCGVSALNAPVGRGLRWLIDPQRRCPRCGARPDAPRT